MASAAEGECSQSQSEITGRSGQADGNTSLRTKGCPMIWRPAACASASKTGHLPKLFVRNTVPCNGWDKRANATVVLSATVWSSPISISDKRGPAGVSRKVRSLFFIIWAPKGNKHPPSSARNTLRSRSMDCRVASSLRLDLTQSNRSSSFRI